MATRPARVDNGAVFTRRWIVELMLDLAGYTSDRDLVAARVVEPSVGDGAFWGPIIERLIAARRAAPWEDLESCLRGWELQESQSELCRKLTITLLTDAGCPLGTAEQLARNWIRTGDFLLADRDEYAATLVVGNPPYIRIEDIPAGRLASYRAACPTMTGRADIFVGFVERGLDLLAPEGRLVYICADRWMRNDYGKGIRRKVIDGFAVDAVLTMHDVNAFEADVAAYPAIVALRRGAQRSAITAEATAQFDEAAAAQFLAWSASNAEALASDAVRGGRLPSWHAEADVWPSGSPETLAWLEDLRARFDPLELDDGLTMLKIGVATGNDAVYCVDQRMAPDLEPDRLMPLASSDSIKSGEFRWAGLHLVNPWQSRGILIELADYPKTAQYFESHREALSQRSTARKSSADKWFKTIDAVHENRLDSPYLALEDMKGHAHPVLIPAGYYPHHNLYAIYSTAWDLPVLGGILLSEVFERQIAALCVKMRGGTLRFQAQYIRRARFPLPGEISTDIADELAAAFLARDRDRATHAALRAYGMDELPS